MSSTATRAANFTNSIAINTHMSYTDGAYASEANVQADLAYLGITTIRDAVPNPNGGVPAANQLAALKKLAAAGITMDLLTAPDSISLSQTVTEIEAIDKAAPGAVIAVEGANEINNFPVTYDGLSGQAAATAFQKALYSTIHGTKATSGIAVYDFTGGVTGPIGVAGTMTRNANGSYTLANGQMGFQVTLPTGISTITLSYSAGGSGEPGSGIFTYPGQGQKSAITYGSNAKGTITYTYNNTSGAAQALYVDFSDYGETNTLTNVKVTAAGSSANLVTFDPNLSLAGEADDANIHPYPAGGASIGSIIMSNYQTAFGTTTPGPARVITETGYSTDPNSANGVSQLVQAQQIVNGLLEAYQDGVATTYLYELLDEKADPNDSNAQMHYGLFNNDNTPKLAALAVHELTTILADDGANATSFTAGSLNDTISGGTAADRSMLLEKSSGVFELALWNDADAGTAKADALTVALGGTYQSVNVYDVVTGVETSYANVSQVSVAVGGDPMIVEVEPNAVVAQINASSVNAASQMSFVAAAAVSGASAAASGVVTAAMAAPVTGGAVAMLNALNQQSGAHLGAGLVASIAASLLG